jgi:hypothetical protein
VETAISVMEDSFVLWKQKYAFSLFLQYWEEVVMMVMEIGM